MIVKILFRNYCGYSQKILLGVYSDDETRTADEKIEKAKAPFATLPWVEFTEELAELQ